MKLKKNYSFFIAILLISFSFFKAQTASDFFISDAKNEKEVLVNCNYPLVNGNCVALSANILLLSKQIIMPYPLLAINLPL